MAFLYSIAKAVATNSSSSLSQSLALTKQDSKWVSDLIRVNTKRHWKKMAVAATCCSVSYGIYRLHCNLKDWQEQQELAVTPDDDVNLLAEMSNVQSTSAEVVEAVLQAMGTTQDLEPEIEDVLEADPCQVDFMRVELDIQPDFDDKGRKLPVCEEKKAKALRKRSRAERKKVREGGFGAALKSLVNRAKLAFPVPKDTELQAQAINLFLYKECRKLNLRTSDAAKLIPKATALCMVPSDVQIECGQLLGIPSIQKRYLKRGWKSTPEPLTGRICSAVLGFVRRQ